MLAAYSLRATTASIIASPAALFVPVATVAFDALFDRCPRGFRSLPYSSSPGISAFFSASASSIDTTANPPHFTFGPSACRQALLCPLLTSATPSCNLSVAVALWRDIKTPRVMHTHLRAYHRRIYIETIRVSIGTSAQLAASSQSLCLVCDSYSSVQRFAYGFLRDSASRRTPLPSASTSPYRVCGGV